MNEYFKAAIERYNNLLPKKQKESGGFLVNPISEVDSEIIIELKELLIKSENQEAITILKEYKGATKDIDILDQLKQCNIDTPDNRINDFDEEEEKSKEIEKEPFLIVNEERFKSRLIFGYSPKDKSTIDVEDYEIILNPCQKDATKLPLYTNHTFKFNDYDDFQKTLKIIDKQMEEANIKFVNKEIDNKNDN